MGDMADHDLDQMLRLDEEPWLAEEQAAAERRGRAKAGKGLKVELIGMDGDGIDTLVVTHDGREILRVTDEIEPEHVRFSRGLAWTVAAIREAYRLGREDERA